MRLKTNLLNWLKRRFYKEPKVYRTLEELPVYNWEKIHSTGKLAYLLDGVDPKAHKYLGQEDLHEIWLNIYQQYIDEFGLSQSYKDWLRIKRKIILLEIKAAISGDKVLLTFANVEKEKLRMFFDGGEKANFNESVGILEKHLGFQIDPKQFSVLKFYTHVKLLNKASSNVKNKA